MFKHFGSFQQFLAIFEKSHLVTLMAGLTDRSIDLLGKIQCEKIWSQRPEHFTIKLEFTDSVYSEQTFEAHLPVTRGDLLLDVLLKYSSAHPHILQLNFADLGLGTQITSINLVENNEELYRFWSAYKAE